MNTLYIGVGTTLILALLAALIGPFFVDWGSYRAVFEQEATKIVGWPVTVIGDVDARLLPSPRIRFGDVVIGDLDKPLARVGRFELDLEIAPLLRGDVHVSELRFERPAVEIAIDRDGRLALPARAVAVRDPAALAIDRIDVVDGRLAVSDGRGGGRLEITRLAATGSAASLAGPWRVEGSGARGGRMVRFHAGGARGADGGVALKLQASHDDDPATIAADLGLRDGPLGPTVGGKVVVERHGAAAAGAGDLAAALATWRAEATISGDTRALEMSDITLALGPEERAAQFAGKGGLVLGAEPSFELTLAAKQIELDRLVRGEAGKTVMPAAVAAEATAWLSGPGAMPIPGRVRAEIQGVVVGGGAVQEIAVDLRSRPGGLALERFDARLPGRTRLTGAGRVDLGASPRFDGKIEVASEQPAALAAWWRAEAAGDRLDAVTLTARLVAGDGALRADDLRVEVAKAKARGFVDWSAASGARVGLTAERLELDQLARLARLFLGREASRRPAALDLELDAGQLVIGGVTARQVAIGVKVAADDVAIERLSVQDLAGARIVGSGRIGDPLRAPRGALDLTVEAAKPEAAARALATLAGADAGAIDRVGGIAAATAPLQLTLHLEGRSEAVGTTLAGSLKGYAGGAEVGFDGSFHGRIDDPWTAAIKVAAKLAGDKPAPALARLVGGGSAGPVGLDLTAEGRPAEGLTVAGTFKVGATSGGLDGRVRAAAGEATRLEGRVRLATPDATALGGFLGRPALAFERRLPVDATALVAGTWPRLDIGEIAGRIGETNARAAGRIDAGEWPLRVEGRVDLDRLDLEGAAETLVGGALAADGSDPAAVWATTPFVGVPLDQTVVGALAISADRAEIEEFKLDRLRMRLTSRPGEVRLDGVEAGLGGGRLVGEVVARRTGDGATALSGRLTLAHAALAELAWRRGGRPVVSGRLDGEVSFTANGRSATALVAGLSGEGRLAVSEARLSGASGEAFATIAKALGDQTPTAEKVEPLFRARLDAGEADLARADLPFALQGGVARSGRTVIDLPHLKVSGRGAVDLNRLMLDADGSIEPAGEAVAATRTAISRATPSVGIAFRGAIGAPERVIDVAPLVAHLTLAGFEREIDRVETLQQDIAERARFGRERRRLEEIRAAEDAARREEAARKVAEEAARKAAAEEARRAAASAKVSEPAKAGETGKAGTGAGVPPAGEAAGSPLPPLPPPIVVAPPPSVGTGAATPPMTIVPSGVGMP